jgi:hypothetical protein
MTDKGDSEFMSLLRQSVPDYHPTDFTDHVAIAYLDYLPDAEVLPLLEQRREKNRSTAGRNASIIPASGQSSPIY